ncbi:MAG: hypothetical protein CMH54_00940 [Myxococcales bacterium]|nr:hypothetical protein [Myxococcales bacterium]
MPATQIRKKLRSDNPNGFWLAFVLTLFILVALGVHRVSMEYRVLHHGFIKAEAAEYNRELREQDRRLRVEIAATKMLQRIQKLGKNHHSMRFPRRGERINVELLERQ